LFEGESLVKNEDHENLPFCTEILKPAFGGIWPALSHNRGNKGPSVRGNFRKSNITPRVVQVSSGKPISVTARYSKLSIHSAKKAIAMTLLAMSSSQGKFAHAYDN
jgi:hypothetical protein